MTDSKQNIPAGDTGWKSLYLVGAAAVLLNFMMYVADIVLTMVTEGAQPGELDAAGWFDFLQENAFLALRGLGLINVLSLLFMIPVMLALFGAHRNVNPAFAGLALLLCVFGAAVYIACNPAIPMLSLSGKYAAATAEAGKTVFLSAGEALLARGDDFTPGSFLGFAIGEIASLMMSAVMLRGKVFSKWAGISGILGIGLLTVYTVCATFVPAIKEEVMVAAMFGGIISMVWYVLLAKGLFVLARNG